MKNFSPAALNSSLNITEGGGLVSFKMFAGCALTGRGILFGGISRDVLGLPSLAELADRLRDFKGPASKLTLGFKQSFDFANQDSSHFGIVKQCD